MLGPVVGPRNMERRVKYPWSHTIHTPVGKMHLCPHFSPGLSWVKLPVLVQRDPELQMSSLLCLHFLPMGFSFCSQGWAAGSALPKKYTQGQSAHSLCTQLTLWINDKLLTSQDVSYDEARNLHNKWLKHQAFVAELASHEGWLENIDAVSEVSGWWRALCSDRLAWMGLHPRCGHCPKACLQYRTWQRTTFLNSS